MWQVLYIHIFLVFCFYFYALLLCLRSYIPTCRIRIYICCSSFMWHWRSGLLATLSTVHGCAATCPKQHATWLRKEYTKILMYVHMYIRTVSVAACPSTSSMHLNAVSSSTTTLPLPPAQPLRWHTESAASCCTLLSIPGLSAVEPRPPPLAEDFTLRTVYCYCVFVIVAYRIIVLEFIIQFVFIFAFPLTFFNIIIMFCYCFDFVFAREAKQKKQTKIPKINAMKRRNYFDGNICCPGFTSEFSILFRFFRLCFWLFASFTRVLCFWFCNFCVFVQSRFVSLSLKMRRFIFIKHIFKLPYF